MSEMERQLLDAEALLKKGAWQEALMRYESLEEESLSPEYRIRRGDAMARCLNNLGRLMLRKDPAEALSCFDRSSELYRELAEKSLEFRPHLANTLVARAEVYAMQKKFWYAKKDYKEAIGLYLALDEMNYRDHIAYARYQLGSIYQEEFNGYDARNQYAKAISTYREAAGQSPDNYLPLLAAALNNMAHVHEDLEDYDKAEEALNEALEAYVRLCKSNRDQYAPYLAATHTHLAILKAEKRSNPEDAGDQMDRAIELYGELMAEHPDQFTHYWATSLHNAGVIRAEAREWKEASAYLKKALDQRWELEETQPGAFTADLCATALNLAECYLNQMESPEQWGLHEKALEVLQEIAPLLDGLPGQPSVQNMQHDHKEMMGRLQSMDRSELLFQYARKQTRGLEDEVDGTLDISEKINYQKGILALWEEVAQSGAPPARYTAEWVRALSNLGWLYIRQGDSGSARKLLEQALTLDPKADAALCNLAHCDLMEGQPDLANEKYRAIWKSTHDNGRGFGEVINQDLLLLVQKGLLKADQLPKVAFTT